MKLSCALLLMFSQICNLLLGQSDAVDHLKTSDFFQRSQLDVMAARSKALPEGTQVSVAMVNKDQVHFYGYTRKNDSLIFIENREAIFEIGSITKVFTSLLMSYAVEENKIQIDQPIRGVLDYELNTDTPITFWHLSNHSAGLPALPSNIFQYMAKTPDNPYKFYTVPALEDYLKTEIKTIDELGAKSTYSNLGAGLLGYLLTKIYDNSFENLLQEKIFNPLGMTHTTTDRTLVSDKLIPGQNKEGAPTPNWDLDALAGAGAICSSVTDMVKFAKFSYTGLSVNQRIQTKTLDLGGGMGIALGWHIYQSGDVQWIWHNGGTGGYRSCMAVDVANQKAVVILSNLSAFHKKTENIDSICFELAKLLEGKN